MTTEEENLKAVRRNGYAIEHIKNPSLEVQMAAVQENGHAIRYIKNPSLEVQIAAVQRFGRAIKFIKNPSIEVQLVAVRNHYELLNTKWISENLKTWIKMFGINQTEIIIKDLLLFN